MSMYSLLELERILDIHEPPVQGKEMVLLERKLQAAQRRKEIADRIAATLVAKEKRRVARLLARTLLAVEPIIRKKEENKVIKEVARIKGLMKAHKPVHCESGTMSEEILYMNIAMMVQIRSGLNSKQRKIYTNTVIEGKLSECRKYGYASNLDEILGLVLCIPMETRDEFRKGVLSFLQLR